MKSQVSCQLFPQSLNYKPLGRSRSQLGLYFLNCYEHGLLVTRQESWLKLASLESLRRILPLQLIYGIGCLGLLAGKHWTKYYFVETGIRYSRPFIIRFHRHLVGIGRLERLALAIRAWIEFSSFFTSREKENEAEPEYFIFWSGVKTRLIFIL